jgi:ABC-type transporter Mla maintaining outer membrane lipid asymmetry ATPase subunit MlaF
MIALGLATNTNLLIMDEPKYGFDIPSKVEFRKLISSLSKCYNFIYYKKSYPFIQVASIIYDGLLQKSVLHADQFVINSSRHNCLIFVQMCYGKLIIFNVRLNIPIKV